MSSLTRPCELSRVDRGARRMDQVSPKAEPDVGRDRRDRGGHLERLLEEEIAERPARLGDRGVERGVLLVVAIGQPLPVGGDDVRDRDVAEECLKALEELHDVVRLAPV